MISSIWQREWKHFNTLSHKTRLLVGSYSLRALAQPIFSLFVNAFIWRQTGSFQYIILYNAGFIAGLPLGFFLNGYLLKKIKITRTHFLGLMMNVVSAFSVIFFSKGNWHYYLVYGLVFGLGSGIYWFSRNYLNFQETISKERNYFYSIISVIGSLTAIAVSFMAGWAITLGEKNGWYPPIYAYWGLAAFAFIFSVFAGLILLRKEYESPVVEKFWRFSISKNWHKTRWLNFAIGIVEGNNFFLPTLLTLFYLGKEGILGTIGAFVSLATMMIVYYYGRISKEVHRGPIFIISIIAYAVCALFLACGGGSINILIFVLFSGLPLVFLWLAFEPYILGIMDDECKGVPGKKYILIFDREIFLNLGRLFSIILLYVISRLTVDLLSFRFTPIVTVSLQAIIVLFAWPKIKNSSVKEHPEIIEREL